MVRIIFPLPSFERKLVKFLKLHKELDPDVTRVVRLLELDINSPLLKTHKLHGKMSVSYACKINYNFRIIFSFDSKYVYLESIGSHDDVY